MGKTEMKSLVRMCSVAALALSLVGGAAQAGSVAISVHPAGSGTTTGAGHYANGSTCKVTATPRTGYDFVAWLDTASSFLSTERTSSADRSYTFEVNEDHELVAFFRGCNERIVAAVANPEEGGTVTGNGLYSNGGTCTVAATAKAGYTFLCWTEDTTVVSTSASYTFTVSADRVLVANFGKPSALPASAALALTCEWAGRNRCFAKLKQVGVALHLYSSDNGEKFPPSLQDLEPKYLEGMGVSCPAAAIPYAYVSGLMATDPPNLIVAFDLPGNHLKGAHVLFLDGHVEWQKDAQAVLRQAEALVRRMGAQGRKLKILR